MGKPLNARYASSITLESHRLCRGLFVSALDRPWVETDFLYQGFLVETEEDLDTLQKICRWVIVDLARSRPEATAGLRPPAGSRKDSRSGAPGARPHARQDPAGPIGPLASSSPRARQARAKRAELLRHRTVERYIVPLPLAERPPEVPEWEPLVKYTEDFGSLKEGLPQAKAVAKAAQDSLAKLARDIVDRGELQLDEIEATASDLTESIVENPNALAWLVRAWEKDAQTYMHNVTVAVYLLTLGRHLGYPPQRLVQFATIGLLLDIGKLFVERAILNKPGPLAEEELRAVQKHVELGLKALAPSGDLEQTVVDGIEQHHEWIDGSGYPKGLKGNEISMEGRLAAIADSFTAMTSPRPYAPSLTAYQAMRQLYRQAGTHYQESLIDKFVQAVGIFPVGSLVELTSGEIAVVVKHNRHRRLEPCVLVLTDSSRKPIESPFEIDLLTQSQLSIEHKLTRISRAVPPGEFDLDISGFYLG